MGDALAVADHLDIDNFATIGLSTGGAYALAAAALASERVTGAVVCCSMTDMRYLPARNTMSRPHVLAVWEAGDRDAAMAAAEASHGVDGAKIIESADGPPLPPSDQAMLQQPWGRHWTAALPEMFAHGVEGHDERDADAAAATLGDAFFNDPLLQIVAPDEARRRRWGAWFMSLPLQYGLRWGEVWVNDDSSAVAVWIPPDSGEMGFGRMLRVGLARMPLRLGVSGFRRFVSSLSKTEPFHKSVDGPHWYLVAVGARIACQGKGLGSALVEVGTSRADEAGVPCYLKTGTQSNIDSYTKRGFEIVGQTEYLGHTLTGMVRQPGGHSTR